MSLKRVAVAIVLVVAVGLAVLKWRESTALAAEKGTRAAIAAQAGEFGEAFLSYDHVNLRAARDRVLRLSSDGFRADYDGMFGGPLEAIIIKKQATATAAPWRVNEVTALG